VGYWLGDIEALGISEGLGPIPTVVAVPHAAASRLSRTLMVAKRFMIDILGGCRNAAFTSV
jgi:hypothetical protein